MSEQRVDELLARIERLEAQAQRRFRLLMGVAAAALCVAAGTLGAVSADSVHPRVESIVSDEIRTRRIVVIDAQGQTRVRLGSDDASDPKRNSQVVGLTIYDRNGDERGGIATADDGSAVIALDAPAGIGATMRDRIGMKVEPNGDSWLALISNRPGFAAVLRSRDETGTLELARPDPDTGRFDVRTIGLDGDTRRQDPMDDAQKQYRVGNDAPDAQR